MISMDRDSQTRMTNDEMRRNDEIRRTKPAIAQLGAFGHSGFGFHSSFVIRHSSFVIQRLMQIRFMVPKRAKKASGLSMNHPLSWPDRSSGPRPVPGRSVWPAPALLENHPRSRLCATAAGEDRPRSESDRFMVPMHARSERGLPMSRDSQTRNPNDEIRMTKPATAQLRA